MIREELIQKLSQVSFCAIPTVQTEDMGLEYDYITPKGAGSSFGNIGDWPAYKLRKIPDDQWKKIKEKVEQKSLTEADLSGTELGKLVDDLHSIYGDLYARFYPDLPDLLAGIKKLPDELPDFYYCRIDCGSWGDKPDFYIDRKSFLEDFEVHYCSYITEWNEMSDEELQDWLDRTADDLDDFPFQIFDEEEDV